MVRHGVFFVLCVLPALASAGGSCENGTLAIDAEFAGGRLDHCEFTADDNVQLTFRAEDFRVDGAFSWFAFRIAARETREAVLKLQFPDSYARFWPKVSRDGERWSPADESTAQRSDVGKSMTLRLDVDETGTWVAAQELLTARFYEDWLTELDSHYAVQVTTIGESLQGRPIRLASTPDRREAVVLLGRQHPGEVPGAIAMREFVRIVLGTSELARQFRARYMLLIVPLVNPDGVALGNARHNAGLTDLNRDWGPFTQPETRSVAGLLDGLDAHGIRPRLMLDFHATRQTGTMIFYTQTPGDRTNPEGFATRWLGRVAARVDDFEFEHAPREPSGLDNTKNYFFARYGIPAITYEVADELDRERIVTLTPAFAEEMMRAMLEAPGIQDR